MSASAPASIQYPNTRATPLIPIRIQFFLCYAILGSIMPYAPVYFAQRGLNDAQIGLVMSLSGVSVILMPVLSSLLADLRLEHRTQLAALALGVAVSLGLLLFSHGYWWLAACYWGWTLATAPMPQLLDGMVFTRQSQDTGSASGLKYHRVRAFGTAGFIVPSFILYVLLAAGTHVGAALACGVGAGMLAAINTRWLPHTHRTPGAMVNPEPVPDVLPHVPEKQSLPTAMALRKMLEPDIAVFCLAIWLSELGFSTYYAFYPIYLERIIGIEEHWLGLISAVGVFLEIGYLLIFGWLIKRFGVKGLALIGIGATALRMGLLATVPTLTIAVGTQLLHGLAVVGTFVLPAIYLNHRAEPSYRNSIQGLYAMLIFGTGSIAGSILSGQIAEHARHGVLTAFLITAAIAVLACFIVIIGVNSCRDIEMDL